MQKIKGVKALHHLVTLHFWKWRLGNGIFCQRYLLPRNLLNTLEIHCSKGGFCINNFYPFKISQYFTFKFKGGLWNLELLLVGTEHFQKYLKASRSHLNKSLFKSHQTIEPCSQWLAKDATNISQFYRMERSRKGNLLHFHLCRSLQISQQSLVENLIGNQVTIS